ncbi:MAG: beta-galactosidase [Armatimonadetes bacterium]|nr:beta-galactosidase [Armatimonadota bacterium]
MRLTVDDRDFLLGGQPIRLLSGAIHYFRVWPTYWHDRLLKLKALGLNTVETYVPWNLHEPRPGEFDFEGILDLVGFLRTAQELDLMAIVRPGPYICSEWDFGGLPAWLLADRSMRLRCAHPAYLAAVDRFFDALIPLLAPLQSTQGGPLIALQVENEYGSYGNDKVYLQHIEDGLRARGIDSFLLTSDGASDWMLEGGTLPHLHKTANFGSDAAGQFAKLREWQPAGPLMCCEFWNGWFDHFGEPHHARDPEDAARAMDDILSAGASLNVYMLHGGTNFGYTGGANHTEAYQPTISSYDYDAALDEAGDPTPKYWAFRRVMAKHTTLPDIDVCPRAPKGAYGRAELTETAPLLPQIDRLSTPTQSAAPLCMEELGQNFGFVLYRATVTGPREEAEVHLQEVHDRAQVFLDGEYRGVIWRNGGEEPVNLTIGPGEHHLDILVEGMGRVNYGPLLADRKGITEGIRLGQQFIYGWTHYPLPLDDLSPLTWEPRTDQTGPAFYRGSFSVDKPLDTYVALPGFTKGLVYVNGFNLGRHWAIGPQRTWYVPGPLLRTGRNEVVVLELHEPGESVEFRDTADLG